MTTRLSPTLIAVAALVYVFLVGPLVIVIGASLSDTKIGNEAPTATDFKSEKPSTISGTRIGRTKTVDSQDGSWMR